MSNSDNYNSDMHSFLRKHIDTLREKYDIYVLYDGFILWEYDGDGGWITGCNETITSIDYSNLNFMEFESMSFNGDLEQYVKMVKKIVNAHDSIPPKYAYEDRSECFYTNANEDFLDVSKFAYHEYHRFIFYKLNPFKKSVLSHFKKFGLLP